MKIWLIILILMLACTCSFAEKQAELPEVIKPEFLQVEGERMYISAETTIYLYRVKDFKFLKQFLKKGEGPQEVKSVSSIRAFSDILVVKDRGKVLFFSREGDYLYEAKNPKNAHTLSPFGKYFLGEVTHKDQESGNTYYSLDVFDKDLNPIRTMQKGSTAHISFPSKKGRKKQIMNFIPHVFEYALYRDRIYLVDTQKGFSITVLDRDGNAQYEINKDYKKIKVQEADKEKFLGILRKYPSIWERSKQKYQFVFPEVFPAILHSLFQVEQDKIYVFTHDTKGEKENLKRELVVLDLKGNVLKRLFVPMPGLFRQTHIHDDTYYYLFENEETEMWEIHTVDIK